MSKKITIEYFGFEGTGSTVKEAKQDAGRKIEALHIGSWTPVLVTWRGHTALLTRDTHGWTKRFLQHDGDPLKIGQGSQGFGNDWAGALHSTQRHIVQLGWNVGDPIDIFPDWFTDPRDRKEAIEYRQWQLNYRELRDRGLSDVDAHRYAGYPREHWPAGPEDVQA
jgi:hypothetical protein